MLMTPSLVLYEFVLTLHNHVFRLYLNYETIDQSQYPG